MNISRRYLPWIALVVLCAPAMQLCEAQKKAPPAPSATPKPGQGPAVVTPRLRLKDWHVAEEFDFDWQGKGTPAHFKIEQNMEEQVSRLTITMKGGAGLVFENDDVWEEFARDFMPDEDFLENNKNLAPSKYAFSLAPSPGAQPLIFLVTPRYGGLDPGTLFVLALDAQGVPQITFRKTFHITEFRDLDGDGFAEIIGKPCFSKGLAYDFVTYDPFHVYKFQAGLVPRVKLSLPLTQEYNLQYYYGWAGADCSEDLVVVLNPPGGGKPVIVKSAEAKKMFEEKNRNFR